MSPKFLITIGTAAALVFLAFVFFTPHLPVKIENASNIVFQEKTGILNAPANGFLPRISGNEWAGLPPVSGSDRAEKPAETVPLPKPANISGFQAQLPFFDNIKKFISPSVPTPQSPKELLALPDVPMSDLSVDKNGVSNSLDYLQYFVTHSAQINFSNEDYKSFPKDDNGSPLSVTGFVDKILSDNYSEKNEVSRSALKKYLSEKINYLKSIKVNGDAILLDRNMLAVDEESLSLIDKVFAAKKGEMSQKDFDDYYSKYKNTIISMHSDLVSEVRGLALGKSGNFFRRLAGMLGLEKIAFAAAPLLAGGPVLVSIPCTCPPWGVEIILGPPMAGPFYLTAPFMASPLFFPYRQTHVGSFDLGLATLPPLTCNAFPICAVSAAPIILDGTSM